MLTVKILVADDENPIRELYSSFLREVTPDVELILCKDGNELYRAAISHYTTIDGIITDWNMPGMNGLDASVNIRQYETGANPNGPQIPIIIISGSMTRDIREAALRAGVTFLEKSGDYVQDLERAIAAIRIHKPATGVANRLGLYLQAYNL